MLRIIDPDEHPAQIAYRVPWHIEPHSRRGVILTNAGTEEVTGVLVTHLATGLLLTPHAHRLAPGDRLEVIFPQGVRLESAVALVAWSHAGAEYIYRVCR